MASGFLSCYSHFVRCSSYDGSPRHEETPPQDAHAVAQLRALLRSSGIDEDGRMPKILVGFSKGVVVLNQVPQK